MKNSTIKKVMLYSLVVAALVLKTNYVPGKERNFDIPFIDRSPIISLYSNFDAFSKDRLKHKDALLENISNIESFNALEQYVLDSDLDKNLKKLEVKDLSELKKKVTNTNLETIFSEHYADTTSKHAQKVISFMRENNVNTEAAFNFLAYNKTGIVLPKEDFEARKQVVLDSKLSRLDFDTYLLNRVEDVLGVYGTQNAYVDSNFSNKNFARVQKQDKKINISGIASKRGVDPLLIKAIIMKESSGNPNAKSSANAKGLLQLIDNTSDLMGVKDPFNPRQNVYGGSKYFKMLYDTYEGYPEPVRLIFTYTAWNSGPGNTHKIFTQNKIPEETKGFIVGVSNDYNVLKSRMKL